MKKHTIIDNYNNWVYDTNKRNEYYKEFCEENEIEYNEDNSFDWALEEANINEQCDWENLAYSKAINGKATLVGKESKYHLWDGYHEVYDLKIKNLYEWLQVVIFDGNDKTYEIYLENGKLHLSWSDHDSPCGGTDLVFRKCGGRFTLKEIFG